MRDRIRPPRRLRAAPAAALAALVVLAGGCASDPAAPSGTEATSVAVVGVGRRDGVAESLNATIAADDLVARLAEGERRLVLEPRAVREALGAASWRALMERDAALGDLRERDIRALAAAGLGTRHALIVRVEKDEVVTEPAKREFVRDESGRVLRDRVRTRYATRRETEVSAELIDLVASRSLWRRTFGADPVSSVERIEYRGSSFSGSVAARLANTVVNGPGGASAPPPASLRQTLESLFDEIDLTVPAGPPRR